MKPETHYGFLCNAKDEKVLLQQINSFLETLHRKTSKATQPALLERYLPLVIKHFYWNQNKAAGTWIDIYPNQDQKGRLFFPNHAQCAWIMRVRVNTPELHAEAEQFISSLLAAITFQHEVLSEGESR